MANFVVIDPEYYFLSSLPLLMLFVYIPWFVLGDEILVTFNLLAANFTFFTLYRITFSAVLVECLWQFMQCSTCIKQNASIRWCCIAIPLGWVEYLCFYCTVCSVVWQTRRLPGWQKYYLEFWACMEIRIQREKSVPVETEDEEEIQQCNSEFTELCTY